LREKGEQTPRLPVFFSSTLLLFNSSHLVTMAAINIGSENASDVFYRYGKERRG
jgi:heme/copper-type cytochrome/quinol oxidase subunit 3